MYRFNRKNSVGADFVWVAEYWDGRFVSEEDSSFYEIDKDMLVRFGLVGLSERFFLEVGSGVLNLRGQSYTFEYVLNDKVYNLADPLVPCRDIITYKEAEACFNLMGAEGQPTNSTINEYCFGYKQKRTTLDFVLYVKIIVRLMRGKVITTVSITTDKDINGNIRVRQNGIAIADIPAPLLAQQSGEISLEL